MTCLLLPSGAVPIALLPATTATASAPALRLVESEAPMPRYKYPVGKTVYVTRYRPEYDFRADKIIHVAVETKEVIYRRTRQRDAQTGKWHNVYTVFGFPMMVREDQISLRARYYRPPQVRTQAVAAA